MDQIQTEEKHEETLVEVITNDSNSDNDDIDFADDYNEPICMGCKCEIDYKSDIFYISGFKYHPSCVKCAFCGKKAKDNDDIDNFFLINPRIFLCSEHYKSYQDGENDFGILDKKKNFGYFLNALFKPIITNFDENSSIYPSDEVFINSEMISNCHLLSKFYKYLFPTATFRFEIEPKNIKFDEFIDILP